MATKMHFFATRCM